MTAESNAACRGVSFRHPQPGDERAASELICRAFDHSVARDWSGAARERFFEEVAPPVLAERFARAAWAELACTAAAIEGVILLASPRKLADLFVEPSRQRRGVGRASFARARAFVEESHGYVSTIELNSTPAALPFYRALGFYPISPELNHRGGRITRMALWLKYDQLAREGGDTDDPSPLALPMNLGFDDVPTRASVSTDHAAMARIGTRGLGGPLVHPQPGSRRSVLGLNSAERGKRT